MLRKVIVTLSMLAVGGYLLLAPPLPVPPQIARGLPSGFAEADTEFARRVRAEFPLPMPVSDLTQRLQADGFAVDEGRRVAIFQKRKFACTLIWRVFWSAADGVVTSVRSKYGGSCL